MIKIFEIFKNYKIKNIFFKYKKIYIKILILMKLLIKIIKYLCKIKYYDTSERCIATAWRIKE